MPRSLNDSGRPETPRVNRCSEIGDEYEIEDIEAQFWYLEILTALEAEGFWMLGKVNPDRDVQISAYSITSKNISAKISYDIVEISAEPKVTHTSFRTFFFKKSAGPPCGGTTAAGVGYCLLFNSHRSCFQLFGNLLLRCLEAQDSA